LIDFLNKRGLKMNWSSLFKVPILYLFFLFFLSPMLRAAEEKHAMVATADPRATTAAIHILEKGGNAVDAAITAKLFTQYGLITFFTWLIFSVDAIK